MNTPVRRTAVAFAAGCLFALTAALLAEQRQARTFILAIDGKEHEITTGQEISVLCAHAAGLVHRIGAAESVVQRFAERGLEFAYPSACTVTWDTGEAEIAVYVRHPAGPVLRVRATGGEMNVQEALERHAASFRAHLTEMGASDIQVVEVASSVAGAVMPGRQLAWVLLGERRGSEIYYLQRSGRNCAVTLDYPLSTAAEAQQLWSTVAPSLRCD